MSNCIVPSASRVLDFSLHCQTQTLYLQTRTPDGKVYEFNVDLSPLFSGCDGGSDPLSDTRLANPDIYLNGEGEEVLRFEILKISNGAVIGFEEVVLSGGGDHGALTGLGDDDHPQYLNVIRGDDRYELKGEGGVSDHGALTGLGDDDHTQYLNNARGDIRYALISHTHAPDPVSDHLLYGDEHTDVDNSSPLEIRQGLFRKEINSELEPDYRAKFVPYFANKTYYPQETVFLEGYLSCANSVTTEYPIPNPIGEKLLPYTGLDPITITTAKKVLSGIRVTSPFDVLIDQYLIYMVSGNHYSIYVVKDPLGVKAIEFIIDHLATETGWRELNFHPILLAENESFDLLTVVNEPDPTPTTWMGNWNYSKPNNTTNPATGQITHANKSESLIHISKTDGDGGDRSAELLALDVGDLVYTSDVDWSISSIQDSGSFVILGIAPAIQSGASEFKQFSFDTVSATPISLLKDTDYWLSFPSLQGLYIEDGAYDDVVADDNAYGLNIRYQQVSQSDQWDIVGIPASGGGGGGSGEVVGLPLMQDAIPDLAAYPDNTFWTRTTDLVLFQLYNDGNSRQWAQPITASDDFIPEVFKGPGTSGYVPDPVTQTGKILLDDGTWGAPPSGGGGGLAPYVKNVSKTQLQESITSSVIIRGGNFDTSTNVTASGGVTVDAISVVSDTWLDVTITTPAGFSTSTLTLDNSGLAGFGNALVITDILVNLNFEFELTTTTANQTMTLPLRSGFNYNMTVNWGDGTSDVITAWDQAEKNHPYVAAGPHKVSISGLCEAWYQNNTGTKTLITRVTNLGHMGWKDLNSAFNGATFLRYFNAGDCDTSLNTSLYDFFYQSTQLSDIYVDTMDVSNVVDFTRTFTSTESLEIDVLSWDTSSAQTMYNMFSTTGSTSVLKIDNLDLTNVTNIYGMFSSSGVLSLDFSSWNTPNLITANSFLASCSKLRSVTFGSGFDTSKVQDLSYFMSRCEQLTAIDLSMLDTSGSLTFRNFFSYCIHARTITLGGKFSTSKATDLRGMFEYMEHIEVHPTAQLDTTLVSDMSYMFYYNVNSEVIPVEGLVGSSVSNISYMFGSCSRLQQMDATSWDASGITNMSGLFSVCSQLLSIDLTGWNTPLLSGMTSFLDNADAITFVDLSMLDVSSVVSFSSTFANCSNLANVDTTGWNTQSLNSLRYAFRLSLLVDVDISHWYISLVTDYTSIFQSTSFSQTNYDKLLPAWAAQIVKPNEAVHFGTAKYSPSNQVHRDTLDFAPNNWTITDGGVGDEEVGPPPDTIPGDGSTLWQGQKGNATYELGKVTIDVVGPLNTGYFGVLPALTDGAVFFKASGPSTRLGFTIDPDTSVSLTDVDFGIYINGGSVEVQERNGANGAFGGTYGPGDEISIRRTGSTIEYVVEGIVRYTSTVTANIDAEFYIDTSLTDDGSYLYDIRLEIY